MPDSARWPSTRRPRACSSFAALGEPPLEEDTPAAARAPGRRASARRPRTSTTARTSTPAASRPALPPDGRPLGLLVYLHGGGWVLGSIAGPTTSPAPSPTAPAWRCCRSTTGSRPSTRSRPRSKMRSPPPGGPTTTPTRSAPTGPPGRRRRLRRRQPGRGGGPAGGVPLRFQLLIYPVTDLRGGTASYEEHASGYYLTASEMSWFVGHYLSGGRGTPGRRPGVTPPRRRRHGAPTPPARS